MKTISGNLKFYLAWFKEVQIFSLFSSDLDSATLVVLNRGLKLVELLKQKNYSPFNLDEQFVLLYAGLTGLLDNIETDKINSIEKLILEEFRKYEFYNENEDIIKIQEDLKESLIDVIKLQ